MFLTEDEARRIAANIAKLPELLLARDAIQNKYAMPTIKTLVAARNRI